MAMRPVLVLAERLLDVIKNSGVPMPVAAAALAATQRLIQVEPDPTPAAPSAPKAK